MRTLFGLLAAGLLLVFSMAKAQDPPPLHMAAAEGYTQTVSRLLDEGADVNGKDSHGATPLHVAALYGQTDVAELLLAAGAEVNASEANQVPFRMGRGRNFAMAEVGKGITPLNWAVNAGHTGVAELLLANGANVNGGTGTTSSVPLRDAVRLGNIAMADLLLAKGAEVNAKRADGKTPLDLAKTRKMRNLLRKYGAE